MKVTEVSKHKAKLDGHIVRLRPVSANSIRGGRFYIRFFNNYAELVRVVGGKFGCDNKHMRRYASYRGKKKIGSLRFSEWLNSFVRDDYYLADLGCTDINHGPEGAQAFEFTNASWNLLNSLTGEQADVLMGRKAA